MSDPVRLRVSSPLNRRLLCRLVFSNQTGFHALLGLLCLMSPSLRAQGASPSASKSLEDCFAAAVQLSETLYLQVEAINQAQEKWKQAIAAILPTVVGSGNFLFQPAIHNSLGTSLYPTFQPLGKITATQNLFQGFREYAGLRMTRDTLNQQRQLKWNAIITLYLQVAQSYYSILSTEADLRDLEVEIRMYDQRIKELKQFFAIGRSRDADVMTAQSQRESYAAMAQVDQRTIRVARETLHYLTGFAREIDLKDTELAPASLPTLKKYLQELERRPDVEGALSALKAAEENERVAFGAHLPSISVLGDYYLFRYGALQDVRWDAQINISVPIFAGGGTQSAVRVAQSQKAQAELTLRQTRRQAEQTVGTYYQTLDSDHKLVRKYTQVTNLFRRTYLAQKRDYQRGLVNNTDVLLALASYQDSQRNLDQSVVAVQLDYVNLEAAVAHRPRAYLDDHLESKPAAPPPRP